MSDIDGMRDWWGAHQSMLPEDVGIRFNDLVRPCVLPGADFEQSKRLADQACTEWVLFECDADGAGSTAFEAYLHHGPELADEARARLALACRTQFFGRFAILGKDGDVCDLADVDTGGRYRVFSERVCAQERWRDGTLGVRIARVTDDLWTIVGDNYLYDRAPAADAPGATIRADGHATAADAPSRYIALLAEVIGIRGRYVESARVRQ